MERLDVQHVAIRKAMNGNHLARIVGPGHILDVGCGTGQWAYEICAEFPDSMVVGLDLKPSKPAPPPNYRYVESNVLQGLPFADGQFDFVHQRLLISGLPLRYWPAEVAELVRVTRPGGWVELHESSPAIEPEGPATNQLYDLIRQLGQSAGLDVLGEVFGSLDRFLAQAGARVDEARTLEVPIGNWAGTVGSLMVTDYRALFTGLAPVFEDRYGLRQAECQDLVTAMLVEFEELQPIVRAKVAVGHRPR